MVYLVLKSRMASALLFYGRLLLKLDAIIFFPQAFGTAVSFLAIVPLGELFFFHIILSERSILALVLAPLVSLKFKVKFL